MAYDPAERPAEYRRRVEADPLPANLGALLDHAVARFGDRPAWIFVDQDLPSLSYRDLGELVARSASAFASLGVRKGSHVGDAAERARSRSRPGSASPGSGHA